MSLKKVIGGAVLLSGAFLLGRFSLPEALVAEADSAPDSERNEARDYEFISPLLSCEPQLPTDLELFSQTKGRVRRLAAAARREERVSDIAVYFRDLNNGPWFGLWEEESFAPASLLKVPLMISYLRTAESDPSLLDRSAVYAGVPYPVSQNYVYADPLSPGEYSVRDLIERMILTSDNTSMDLLTHEDLISLDALERVYTDLGIHSPMQGSYDVDARTYASFFRVLYNSTYLSRANSEYALSLLAESHFDEGLRAGLPEDVAVAHKFGERADVRSGERQLHDCGIVYAPGHPYVLCIMTRGEDFARLSSVIAEISRVVYETIR